MDVPVKYLIASLHDGILNVDIPTVTDLNQIYDQADDEIPPIFLRADQTLVIIHIQRHDMGTHYGYTIGHEARYHRVEGGYRRGEPLPDRLIWRAIDGTTFDVSAVSTPCRYSAH